MTISYEKKEEKSEEKEFYTRKEFGYNTFSRSFVLLKTIDTDKIEANYNEGVLTLILPKKEEAKKKGPPAIKVS